MKPQWLAWATQLQAIAQNGLTYSTNVYDIERFQQVLEIASEMFAKGSDLSIERIRGLFSEQVGYATPKIDVRGVVFRSGKMLLTREREDGLWTLPGGWADPNESPGEAVVREVREESGFDTSPVKLLAVYDRSKHPHEPPFAFHIYKIFILCDITGGSPRSGAETLEVDFFGENELPELSISRVTRWQIERFFEHLRHPEWPADFD